MSNLDNPSPALLTSYVSLKPFLKNRLGAVYRDWVLDSGAYSALTSGVTIDLSQYIEEAGTFLAEDATLTEVFALDVIGDPERSLRNCEQMWKAGVKAIPTFHYGSPWHYLEDLGRRYQKIALGGLVARGKGKHGTILVWKERLRFIEQCFARVWPKWIHGFGCTDIRLLSKVPFVSTDSVTWCYSVSRYGVMNGFGSLGGLPSEKIHHGVRVQLARHLKIESEVRGIFGRLLKNASLPEYSLRLGVSGPELKYLRSEDAKTAK